jgi:hypothetical protein
LNRIISLSFLGLLMPAILSAQTIVNDSWADGGRSNGADPLDTDWRTSTARQAIEVGVGYLGLVTTTTVGRGIHGTFAPQALNIGDTLTATFTFKTPTTIGSGKQSAFRIGFFDTTGKPGLAADLTASSASPNPICNGLPGYMMDFDLKTGTEDIQFRKHDVNLTTGQLMANTTPDYINIASGGAAYSFAANTTYTGVLSLKRTGADTLSLTGGLHQGAALLSTYTGTDTNRIVSTFGMLAFHVTSATFGGAAGTPHPDNGIDFSNVKVEYRASK